MEFSTFSRQSSKGAFLMFLSKLKNNIGSFAVLIFLLIRGKSVNPFLFLLIPILFIWYLAKAVIEYENFMFKISDDNFILKKGFLKKKEIIIPFEKIINVNLTQNIVQQFFKVMQVEIETAGSDEAEVKIEALSKENAIALKKILIENNATTTATSEIEEVNYLQKITIKELFKEAITENHLQSFALIIAFFMAFYSKIEDFIKDSHFESIIIGTVEDGKSALLNSFWIVFLLAVFSSLLVSFGRIFTKHFKLKTLLKNDAIEIQQGLFNYKNNIIKISRVQYLKISTNPLKKIYGIFNIRFLQATSGTISAKKTIKTVGVTKNQLQKITDIFYKTKDLLFPEDFTQPHSYYKRQLFIRWFLLLLLINGIGIIRYHHIAIHFILIFNLIAIIVILFLVKLKYNRTSFSYNNTHIQVNGGLISDDKIYFEYYKIQKISLRQTIFQKKRNIADIHLQTASGEITLPCVACKKAIEMYNHFLLTVEKSDKNWV